MSKIRIVSAFASRGPIAQDGIALHLYERERILFTAEMNVAQAIVLRDALDEALALMMATPMNERERP